MGNRIEELTTDLDRRNGERRFRITSACGYNRAEITTRWETDVSPPDEAPHFASVAHPPVNGGMVELLLELLAALHPHRNLVALPSTPPVKLPTPP